MDSVEVGGLTIGYQRVGDGPPIVLMHGFVGDSREWRAQLDGLSNEFTVIAWDAPGAGGSSDPPDTFRIGDYAECVAGFVRAVGFERANFVGLSFGGIIALELWRGHQAVPRALVLAGAYAGWPGSLAPEIVEERLELCLRLAAGTAEEFVTTLIPGMFSSSPPKQIVDELSTIMSQFHPRGFAIMARSCAEADLRDALPRIDVPTLILNGDEDARATLDVANGLYTAIPDAKLVVMAGVGHMSNMEAPERMNAEIRSFLKG